MQVEKFPISGRVACPSYISTCRPRHCQDLQKVHIPAETFMPKLQLLRLTSLQTQLGLIASLRSCAASCAGNVLCGHLSNPSGCSGARP